MKRIIFTSLLIVGFFLGLVGSMLKAADPEFTPVHAHLMLAIAIDHNETVHQIVADNPDILNTPLPEGKTFLMVAAQAGNETVVDLCIKNGADLKEQDKEGHTAFWHASNNDHKALAQKMVRKIVNEHELDKQSKVVDDYDTKMQATVELRKALEQKKPVQEVIAALEKGADPDVQLSEKNALIVSAEKGRMDYVAALLGYGADPFASRDGRDAIIAAEECGRRDICRIISAARKFNNENLYKKLIDRDHRQTITEMMN